ncbi:MAG: squalene/phytoene synthase family protein, partial [Steroidobacteraceae bacterium]
MIRESTQSSPGADEQYQRQILLHVSRTFALTIPQLPGGLREAVTTAYLLCRIADTIEDEATLSAPDKLHYLTVFSRVVAGTADAAALAAELTPLLSQQTSAHERDLVGRMASVMRVCQGLDPRAQQAIGRCVEIMCVGMH